jgi:hypothetical protein
MLLILDTMKNTIEKGISEFNLISDSRKEELREL